MLKLGLATGNPALTSATPTSARRPRGTIVQELVDYYVGNLFDKGLSALFSPDNQ
jgi:hypothetical protein